MHTLIRWKPIISTSDKLFNLSHLDKDTTLLRRIETMADGTPISLRGALMLFYEELAFSEMKRFDEIYKMDIVTYCLDIGHKIILDGTEFEIITIDGGDSGSTQ